MASFVHHLAVANPGTAKSPFPSGGIRLLAMLLDLILIVMLRGAISDVAPLSGDNLAAKATSWLLAFAYLALLPLTPLQGTLGKWICRIRLADLAGRRLTPARSMLRAGAFLAWFWLAGSIADLVPVEAARTTQMLYWFVFPFVWAPMWLTPRHRSVFDLIAGSVVLRMRATPEEAAQFVVPKPRISSIIGVAIAFFLIGGIMGTLEGAHSFRDRIVRVVYAINQVASLKESVAAFHAREKRWPTAAELGVQEWTPYPAGGGYRLQSDGSIRITFSVLPELKGHSIVMRPTVSPDGNEITWKCIGDAALRDYLPGACR